ncbi:hypothetical protein HRbin37_02104 [bacterium HR37]|jgi:hypothetical protein|nr:hypothetical protein HRbin37_02104 [bacterium HR37]
MKEKTDSVLTLDEWKDLYRQIDDLLKLTWKCAQSKAEEKMLELRKLYIDKVEMLVESGETYLELDVRLKEIAKRLKPPLDKHAIWEAIKPEVEPRLKETYEKVFKLHRRNGFDKVATVLRYMEKLGLPREARESTPKWLEEELKLSDL